MNDQILSELLRETFAIRQIIDQELYGPSDEILDALLVPESRYDQVRNNLKRDVADFSLDIVGKDHTGTWQYITIVTVDIDPYLEHGDLRKNLQTRLMLVRQQNI